MQKTLPPNVKKFDPEEERLYVEREDQWFVDSTFGKNFPSTKKMTI